MIRRTGTGHAMFMGRVAQALTIEKAAAHMGVGPSTWWRWETGRRPPSAEQLQGIAAVLERQAAAAKSSR